MGKKGDLIHLWGKQSDPEATSQSVSWPHSFSSLVHAETTFPSILCSRFALGTELQPVAGAQKWDALQGCVLGFWEPPKNYAPSFHWLAMDIHGEGPRLCPQHKQEILPLSPEDSLWVFQKHKINLKCVHPLKCLLSTLQRLVLSS